MARLQLLYEPNVAYQVKRALISALLLELAGLESVRLMIGVRWVHRPYISSNTPTLTHLIIHPPHLNDTHGT